MRLFAWLRCHLLHRHAVCLLVDGNRYWRYCKDCERTLDDKGNPTGHPIRRAGLTSGERAEWERDA